MIEQERTTVTAMPESRFGGYVPKNDPRVQFSLCRVGEKLYFLNQSNQMLNRVSNASNGVGLIDDEGGTVSTSTFKITYETVAPGEAVLIDEFDEIWDSDFLINTQIIGGFKSEVQHLLPSKVRRCHHLVRPRHTSNFSLKSASPLPA